MPRLFIVLVALQLIAGCANIILKPDMTRVKDQPAAYQDGYRDGCNSGYVAGGSMVHTFTRDTQRIDTDEEYQQGWKFGYRQCKYDFREMCKTDKLLSKADLYCSDVRQQGLDKE